MNKEDIERAAKQAGGMKELVRLYFERRKNREAKLVRGEDGRYRYA